MRKVLISLSILMSIPIMAEQTIKLEKSVIKNNSRTADYNTTPKEYKNTYVITQEKIQERNYKNVEDVLRDAPGVIVQNTAFGPRVDMRASGEKSLQRVKVLVDGISINPTEETMASLPINSIPIETVKKVEIIPGGGATLYGSGSVGGVVSITTNSNATKNNFFMDLNYASYDNRNFGFAGGYNVNKNLYLNYGFNYLNQTGYREEDERENKIYLVGFDYKINDKNRFRIQTRHSDMKHDSSTELSREELETDRRKSGLNMDLKTKDKSYTLDYEYRPTNDITVSATGYLQKQDRDIIAEDIRDISIKVHLPRTLEPIVYDFENIHSIMKAKFIESKKGLKIKGKYEYEKGELFVGYDYQKSTNKRASNVSSETLQTYNNQLSIGNPLSANERKPIVNNVDINLNKISHALYGFNKFKINEEIDFTTGGRIEWTKYNGYRKNGPNSMPFVSIKPSQISTNQNLKNYAGEVGLLYKYNDTGRAFVRYERGFVTPFANQLTDKIMDVELDANGNYTKPVVNSASRYVDNHLRSEETNTFEVGLRDYYWNSLISASLFLTDTKDEITLISSGITNPAVNRWKYKNIGKTRRMGVEFEAEQQFGNITLNQSLTLLDTKVLVANEEANLERGDKVPVVPRIKASLGLKYRLNEKLYLLGNYTYIGKQEARELDENDKVYKHNVSGHGIVDVGILYKADAYSNMKIGAKNILNKKYNLRETKINALPAPERNYYLELNVKF